MMDYSRSTSVDENILKESGCITTLPVRKSKFNHIAIESSRELLHRWRKDVKPVNEDNFCSHPLGHLVSLCVPECLPERMAGMAQMLDIAFYHDDMVDDLCPEDAQAMNNTWADGYKLGVKSNKILDQMSGKRQIECKVLLDILEIDREDGLSILNLWTEQHATTSGTHSIDEFKTFDDCLLYRYGDAGIDNALEMARFCMGIKVSDAEKESVWHITKPILFTVPLINDYYSWEKELRDYTNLESTAGVTNCIWIIMKQSRVNTDDAKKILAEKILELEEEYRMQRSIFNATHPEIPLHVNAYIDAAQWMSSGSSYWSSFCYRYNGKEPVVSNRLSEAAVLEERGTSLSKQHISNNGSPEVMQYLKTESEVIAKSMRSFTAGKLCSLDETIILAPFNYLHSLPSKGVREVAIEALNIWFQVPKESLAPIRSIVKLLHSSSLMSDTINLHPLLQLITSRLDDIEDQSPLRRGKPATHMIFGEAQTIHSANYLFVLSLEELFKLSDKNSQEIYLNELKNLHLGQSLDLYWTCNASCPSESEYIAIVDNKTGGLFRLLGRLMQAEGKLNQTLKIEYFTTLVGRYFQIRDDYQNLCSPDYTNQKGFCEDLDEGKFSLPLIHTLACTSEKFKLQSILNMRLRNGKMTFEMKQAVLEMMRECGSLEYVAKVLKELESTIEREIGTIEEATEIPNYVIRLLVERLKI